MRERLAPSDSRTAISRWRATARASMTFDTLAQAVTRTSTNAAKIGESTASSSNVTALAVAFGSSTARTSFGEIRRRAPCVTANGASIASARVGGDVVAQPPDDLDGLGVPPSAAGIQMSRG